MAIPRATASCTWRLLSVPRAMAMLIALPSGCRGGCGGWRRCFAGLPHHAQPAGGGIGRTQPGGDPEAKIRLAALLAVQLHSLDNKEDLVAFQSIYEAHHLRILSADRGV